MEEHDLSKEEAQLLMTKGEGHFLDYKSARISPRSLSKTISGFANSSGGEVFVGISEENYDDRRELSWEGLDDREAANPIIALLETLGGIDICRVSFLRSDGLPGCILQIIVKKSRGVVLASNGLAYVRRGAQNLKVDSEEGKKRLELEKGVVSFEDETLDISLDTVGNSITTIEFMISIVPNAEPETWMKSQFLLHDNKPTVAAVLLFSDEPQAAIPKRSGVKIFRYTTADEGIDRDQLAFDPVTIEGSICDQIYKAVDKTITLVEGIKRLTEEGLDEISYPNETLHEIITNAVLHRDYSIATDIQIRIYDDRIEVHSPGRLPGHITVETILDEQFARNPKIVRIANKFPNPPNKDVGEGLNTAFNAMKKIRLQEPEVIEEGNYVVVYIRHQRLASPAQIITEYLETNEEITNRIGREITGLRRDVQVKDVFVALRKRGIIESVPDKRGRASAWRLKRPIGGLDESR